MKKINYLFATIAAVGLVACSSEEVASVQDFQQGLQTSEGIAFSPLSKNATRSTVINSTSDITSFKVRGTWKDAQSAGDKIFINGKEITLGANIVAGAEYVGQVQEAATAGTYELAAGKGFGTGIEIVNNSGAWNYKNTDQTQYWPFVAQVDPSDASKVTGYTCLPLNFKAVTPASSSLDLTASTYTYTVPALTNMTDICYAVADNKTNKDAPVEMKFNHILSQIVVKAKKADGYDVEIKEVVIGGVMGTGTLDLTQLVAPTYDATAKKSSGTQWGNFTGDAGTYTAYTSATAYTVPASAADASPIQITPSGQELLLLPQDVKAWDPKASTLALATAPNIGYIKIVYRAKKSTETWPDANFKTTYYPLGATWYAGKIYSYTLLFGGATDPDKKDDTENPDPGDDNPGGYDEDGKPNPPSVPITFTASVTDWESEAVDIKF